MTYIDAYEAALKGAVYFHQPQTGFLRVAGRDRLDFLQRQTTNDLRLLSADRSVSTVLTSPTARISDLFCVVEEGDSLGTVTLPGRFSETAKFLRSRIFFSDQVTVEDLSGQFAQILLFGPQMVGVLEKLDIQPPKPDHVNRWEIDNQPITIIGQKILTDVGYRVLAPITSLDALIAALDGAGVISIDPENFEILRVEAGQPGPAGELVEAYTPLEVGLQGMISDSKGCYTGQEIIARQITYDKVTKNLVGIKLNDLAEVGAEIKTGTKSAGLLTSVAQSPRFGPIALGVVRRQYSETGSSLSIIDTGGSTTSGEVVALPFSGA